MLSIGSMSGGQGKYYTELAREDYYLKGGEPPGFWLGSGAEKLGFQSNVQQDDFLDLFKGMMRGKPVVQSAGKPNHRPGWDLTFSAPKSVSVAWCLADRETALEIRAAHLTAVERAVQYLEAHAVWTRRGRAGERRERCGLLVAAFEHGSSRAQDPQLHTHACLLNVGLRVDGTIGTLETEALYEHKMAAGAIYRAELSHQLTRRLGFAAEREKSWFELRGIPKALCDFFSKRRKEIEQELEKTGFHSAKAAEIAAFATRQVKGHVAREALIAEWRKVGEDHGFGTAELQALQNGQRHVAGADKALRSQLLSAPEKLTERRAFFAEKDLVRLVAESAQVLAVGAEAIVKGCRDLLRTSPDIVPLGLRFREAIYTTREMVRIELDLMKQVGEAAAGRWAGVSDKIASGVFSIRSTITEEQKHAVRHITQETGGIATVTGMAGTGKTYMLEATRLALELGGYRVRGAALSGKAANGLQQGSGIRSSTIASLLHGLGTGREELDAKTVLVIDEAGMVGTRQMHALVGWAKKASAKLVLVGDEKQLQPIDAGAPFAAISKAIGTANLTEIIRQREPWQRQGVADLAYGRAKEALFEYARRGLVSVAPDREAGVNALIEKWQQHGLSKPEEHLVVASTNLDVVCLNREIQKRRKALGYVRGDALSVGGEVFYEGDRVLFTKISNALGVTNGLLGTVRLSDPSSGRLTVCLDGGGEREFSTRNYQHVKLGYAVTTHKAQGMTTENAYLLTSESMQDREISYVQASRARGRTEIFTTEAEAGENLSRLSKTVARSHRQEMATTAAHTPSSTHSHSRSHSSDQSQSH